MEELDQSGVALSDVSIRVGEQPGKEFQDEYAADLLDGVVVLRHNGAAYEATSGEELLYAPVSSAPPKTRSAKLTLIPYYAWANRQPTAMQVWARFLRA
jgi:hypothetical protein